AERNPAERNPAERNPAERNPAERNPAERNPAERNPADPIEVDDEGEPCDGPYRGESVDGLPEQSSPDGPGVGTPPRQGFGPAVEVSR
ncbi:hypothetical protein AB0J90_12760, partial [Micromonospora sp. NPDC049523]|uniref:hypothetical protein n=1 Tax=Micromonospora sp. NPDC049523 TaxID=3155921 RepID=UPI003426FFFD